MDTESITRDQDARVRNVVSKLCPEIKMPPVTCKEQDFLEQDAAIRGQNYVCLSFLNPGDAVASKEAYTVSKFLTAFCEDAKQVLQDAEKRASSETDRQVVKNLQERYAYVFDKDALLAEFEQYKSSYEEQILADYAEKTDNQACVYGIKIRGAHETLDEARARAQHLKTKDPNFNVYVCEMGCWCPWSPNPEGIREAEYGETQLNTLMKKYKENMALKDDMYEKRKDDLLNAIKEVPGIDACPDDTTTGYDAGVSASADEVFSSLD
jgi:hypothetical protein